VAPDYFVPILPRLKNKARANARAAREGNR
jgi:hypothetical protein